MDKVARYGQPRARGHPPLHLRQLLEDAALELAHRQVAHLFALALAVEGLEAQRELRRVQAVLDDPDPSHGAAVDVPRHHEAAAYLRAEEGRLGGAKVEGRRWPPIRHLEELRQWQHVVRGAAGGLRDVPLALDVPADLVGEARQDVPHTRFVGRAEVVPGTHGELPMQRLQDDLLEDRQRRLHIVQLKVQLLLFVVEAQGHQVDARRPELAAVARAPPLDHGHQHLLADELVLTLLQELGILGQVLRDPDAPSVQDLQGLLPEQLRKRMADPAVLLPVHCIAQVLLLLCSLP
mmetsp:Transcript_29950/g.82550  ORF Transcript_29950/g.82550 Transcript_29950/m.82550 type:complete len:293 (-) Transcript_29950:707-1585(-)